MNDLDNMIGNWIQINDNENVLTIENYDFNTGVIAGTTGKHCILCVAANQCWFKNELGKKPKKFDISSIKVVDFIIKGLSPGLYHPNCHCTEVPINIQDINQIKMIIPKGKIDWLVKDKIGWIQSMGYEANEDFINLLKNKIKESYFLGKYIIQDHTNFGVKIKLYIDIPGYGLKSTKNYKLTASFMVFPNGKIKCNTLIGGWQK